MLKKLKRKFIIINMLMVGIVILIVFAVVCIHTYTTEKNKVVDRLEQAIIIRENMVDYLPEIGTFGKKSNIGSEYIVSAITVQLDGDNQMFSKIEINATMSEEGLEKAVGTALAAEEDCGIISSMNIMYLRRTNARGIKIAFTDITEFQNSVKSAAVGGGLLCAAVLAVMFAVSVILSSLAIRPVKDAWTKQKQFIADASHELKTPLTVILANNNILQSHPGDSIADQKQWLESTEEEASRMKKLIDQMLFLAKSDAEQSPVVLSKINISEIAERSALTFEPVAFEKNVNIATAISPNIIINSEPALFDRLLHILLDNAVKHAEKGSTVKLVLGKDGVHTVIFVNNTGDIIAPEDLPHIFDRFYRADKSRTDTGGYGLGLAIAKNILKTLGGSISVTSDSVSGTTFRVYF